jgi:hypothetical protein
MSGNTNLNLTVDAWSQFVIERWKKKINALQIGYSQSLEDSLSREVFSSSGNISKVEFSFNYYGKFTDMGVGRGVSLGDVGSLQSDRSLSGNETGNRRRPKKWHSKTFFTEVAKLKFILAENYAHAGTISIRESIDDKSITIKSK